MQRLVNLFILVPLLTGCAALTRAKSLEEYRMPTEEPVTAELTATVDADIAASTPPKDCPLTVPPEPAFVPPAPYDAFGWKGHFWFGSASLWTSLPSDGVWGGLPFNSTGYTQKVFWWRDGYVWTDEPQPDLVVTGERLDAKSPPLRASKATNAYASDIGSAMLVGVDFPSAGCWRITGKYGEAELGFVVWVKP